MHGAVATIAPHRTVAVVERPTNKTRLPGLHGEEFILNNHAGIHVCFLNLVLHGIAVKDRTADSFTKLNFIEDCATDWATIGTLNPRRETRIVEVVLAGQKVRDGLVIDLNTITTCQNYNTGLKLATLLPRGNAANATWE
jgi:hypothetical protein